MTAPQIQQINLGNYANDGTGDDLRTAFQKVNNNFNVLFGEGAVVNGTNLGDGTAIFADKNNSTLNLEFKTLTSTDSSVTLTHNDHTVNLRANTRLESDPAPTLGHNLDLNGFFIGGNGSSDVRTNVWGYDLRILGNLVSLLLQSSSINVDFGSFEIPAGYSPNNLHGYDLDFQDWRFGDPESANQVDFGSF
jgi:hypothetical protein